MIKTGVYQIRNVTNSKRYIGSAAGKGFDNRWKLHVTDLTKNQHHSSKLQNAWNKYGADSFIFEILLYCDPKNCLMYEQIALDHYQPEYNICMVAGSNLGVKRSEETKNKISIAKTGILGSAHPRYGKSHTSVAKQKMSFNHADFRGDKHPFSKLSDADVKKIKVLIVGGMQQKEIAVKFGVATSTISNINTGKTWSHIYA